MKPQIILQLEKELNTEFTKVDISKIINIKWQRTVKYSINQNKKIIGLSITKFNLENIYNLLPTGSDLLNSLTHLNLYQNNITDISILKNFRCLQELYLQNNKIADISLLKELTNLSILHLENNEIIDISALKYLKRLRILGLMDNKISNISPLMDLIKLTKLNLNGTKISDIFPLRKLQNITELSLVGNDISDISALRELKNITYLNLSWNEKITDISVLKELKKLTELKLMRNVISDISSLKELKNLTELDLSENIIFNISSLKKLKKLTILNLQWNEITDISSLKELETVKELRLHSNLISDISALSKLKKITILDLQKNEISDISALKEISKIKNLNLQGNNISNISALKNLINLQELNLKKNPINKLNNWICNFPKMDIKWTNNIHINDCITLYDNPIEKPPIEIIKQGKEAIKNYFAELEKGTVNLYETKLLLVGHGAVGKTTLMKRLIYDKYNEHEKTTEGIDIREWDLQQNNKNNLRINTWDFGGQDIYYSTHQYFLSKRSIYILVWDARIEKMMPNMASFDYWLNIVSLLSENSPILVVHSKVDERIKRINETLLLRHFPNIVGFYNVSAKTGTGIKELRKVLRTEIQKLPHIGEQLPKIWLDIRNKLSQTKQEFINYSEYISLCKSFQLNTQQALHLSDYFHDLGIFLHFQKNDILRNLIFLKPNWATNSVYKIIDTKEVVLNYGKFNSAQLPVIWDNYPEDKYAFLIELMKKFELCFLLPESNDYLVPELFPANEPSINWDYNDNLHFEFRYKFMPAGIITRLIVRMHDYIKNNIFWFQGAIIEREQTKAVITSDILERHIKIKIKGKNKQDLFGIIRYEIERINKTLKQPYVELMTPCLCVECQNSKKPHFFAFSKLNKALSKGKETIECQNSFENVSINKLLGKVNGNGRQKSLFDYILLALKQLQGLSANIQKYEDSRNSFVANVLTNKNFNIKDQTQWSKSEMNKKAGEIDIKIDDDKGETIAIYEAFNLKYFDKTKIQNHLKKIFNYDANGLYENYIIVYCDKNFMTNWEKYIIHIPSIDYEFKLLDFTDISNNYNINANIKVGIATHERNKKQLKVYHIFVELTSTE